MKNKDFAKYQEKLLFESASEKDIDKFYTDLTSTQQQKILLNLVMIIQEEIKQRKKSNENKNKENKSNPRS